MSYALRALLAATVTLSWAATIFTAALPVVDRRAPIASDQVVSFTQLVPSGSTGQLYLAYQPLLKVTNGCVPFPAVDSVGNTKLVAPARIIVGALPFFTDLVYVSWVARASTPPALQTADAPPVRVRYTCALRSTMG